MKCLLRAGARISIKAYWPIVLDACICGKVGLSITVHRAKPVSFEVCWSEARIANNHSVVRSIVSQTLLERVARVSRLPSIRLTW